MSTVVVVVIMSACSRSPPTAPPVATPPCRGSADENARARLFAEELNSEVDDDPAGAGVTCQNNTFCVVSESEAGFRRQEPDLDEITAAKVHAAMGTGEAARFVAPSAGTGGNEYAVSVTDPTLFWRPLRRWPSRCLLAAAPPPIRPVAGVVGAVRGLTVPGLLRQSDFAIDLETFF